MIRVTVELVSAINPARSCVLGVAEICNDAERSQETRGQQGDYLVRLDEPEEALASFDVRLSKWQPKTRETWKRGRVEKFDRKRLGAWDLLYVALRAIVGRRNP